MLKHAECADVFKRAEKLPNSLLYFIKRFPIILPPGATINMITQEYLLYQSAPLPDSDSLLALPATEQWNKLIRMN